ncbi:MAG: hypothetical protein IKV13_05365 [Akkermansia sp.]|nr:hypothetical protein [Akkermansia sp.]
MVAVDCISVMRSSLGRIYHCATIKSIENYKKEQKKYKNTTKEREKLHLLCRCARALPKVRVKKSDKMQFEAQWTKLL